MKVNSTLTNGAVYLAVGTLLSACGSLISQDDDIPLPPVPREARQLRIPADLATNRPERSPVTAAIATTQRAAPIENLTPPAIVPIQPQSDSKVADSKPSDMLFAPYLPSVKEGAVPTKWQKSPVYDFPWIPGAEPTRVNEETVVGAGDQMLGRLYARKVYSAEPATTVILDEKTPPVVKEEVVSKKTKPNKKTKAISLETEQGKTALEPEKTKPVMDAGKDCDGVTCLDAARDALVADAESKGWQMLLNRRVSLHQSFQFGRSGRVIWIELNSNGLKELSIEYSLMPKQNVASKK